VPIIEPEFMELTTDLDVESFWAENDACEAFTTDKPRCALSFSPDDHWLFEFMHVPSTLRYYQDKQYRDELHREANRVTLQHVGKMFFEEDTWIASPRRIENLFGSEFAYIEDSTPWLTHVTNDPDEFARILDRAEATDMKTWAVPEDYRREWEERKARGLPTPELGTGSRGPATIMTSVLQPETVFYWMYDHPDLMRHFRDILARKMVELNQVLREFSGMTDPGWWITDDNSALFNRKLYREYCFPVLEQVLAAIAPAGSRRYQHSDSAMGHLLDQQRELGINSVNYGPTVDVGLIRKEMPDAVINGHTPPLLLRNASPEAVQARLISDFEKAGATGGLIVTTAGSLAAGTGVGRMRWYMKLARDYCRYDRGA
jgi:uroporphyrinogen decarboxylase